MLRCYRSQNTKLDQATTKLQGLIDSGEKPLDDIIIVASKKVIKMRDCQKFLLKKCQRKQKISLPKQQSSDSPLNIRIFCNN